MRLLTGREVAAAAEILRQGGVVVLPTETVYGLACRWGDAAARERIYRLKRRPASKRLPMLAHDLETAVRAGVRVTSELRKLARAFWPGALTAVVPCDSAEFFSVGLRIPAHAVALELLRELGEPLACTSANLSGQPATLTVDEALRSLDGEPDAAIDTGTVTVTGGRASTVVSLLQHSPEILREGPIGLPEILQVLNA